MINFWRRNMIQHLKKVPYFGSKLIRGDLFNLASPKLRKSQIRNKRVRLILCCGIFPQAGYPALCGNVFRRKKVPEWGVTHLPLCGNYFCRKSSCRIGGILPRTFAEILCNVVFNAIPLKLNTKACRVEEACISFYTCLCRTLFVRFLILSNFFWHR